jgi:hypothetical protein
MNNILSTPSSEKSQGSRISRDDYKNEWSVSKCSNPYN